MTLGLTEVPERPMGTTVASTFAQSPGLCCYNQVDCEGDHVLYISSTPPLGLSLFMGDASLQ